MVVVCKVCFKSWMEHGKRSLKRLSYCRDHGLEILAYEDMISREEADEIQSGYLKF